MSQASTKTTQNEYFFGKEKPQYLTNINQFNNLEDDFQDYEIDQQIEREKENPEDTRYSDPIFNIYNYQGSDADDYFIEKQKEDQHHQELVDEYEEQLYIDKYEQENADKLYEQQDQLDEEYHKTYDPYYEQQEEYLENYYHYYQQQNYDYEENNNEFNLDNLSQSQKKSQQQQLNAKQIIIVFLGTFIEQYLQYYSFENISESDNINNSINEQKVIILSQQQQSDIEENLQQQDSQISTNDNSSLNKRKYSQIEIDQKDSPEIQEPTLLKKKKTSSKQDQNIKQIQLKYDEQTQEQNQENTNTKTQQQPQNSTKKVNTPPKRKANKRQNNKKISTLSPSNNSPKSQNPKKIKIEPKQEEEEQEEEHKEENIIQAKKSICYKDLKSAILEQNSLPQSTDIFELIEILLKKGIQLQDKKNQFQLQENMLDWSTFRQVYNKSHKLTNKERNQLKNFIQDYYNNQDQNELIDFSLIVDQLIKKQMPYSLSTAKKYLREILPNQVRYITSNQKRDNHEKHVRYEFDVKEIENYMYLIKIYHPTI